MQRPAIANRTLRNTPDFDIAPNGNRAVFSARGDIFTLLRTATRAT